MPMKLPAEFVALGPWSYLAYGAYERVGMDYLVSRGFDPREAAAIMGNLDQESRFNPDARRKDDAGPGNDSLGIEQDNRGRLAAMQSFVAILLGKPYTSLSDPEKYFGQLAFAVHELGSTFAKTAAVILRQRRDSPTLAAEFGHVFEGFSAASGDARNANAARILAAYERAA